MKKSFVIIGVVIALVAFLAGYLVSGRGGKPSAGGRKILYYVDPMHPAYRSDKPGIAPDCGMPLEPVYADGGGTTPGEALPPGAVKVSPEQQQLIGVRTATVEQGPVTHTVRVLGRVVPDENRVYRINSSLQGYVKEVSPVTTGTFVEKDQYLGAIYSPELYSIINSYIFSLNSIDRQNVLKPEDIPRLRKDPNVRGTRNSLINLGMSETQLDEILMTRRNKEVVDIRATIAGYVLQRNISLGERFERGTVFYQIADLSRVWVLADIFEKEASYFTPGVRCTVRLPHRNATFTGRVGSVLPLYDPATRTLKVRLEVDNAGMILRPEMFVEVELPVTVPSAIVVPRDAVLDTGLNRTIFIERGNGIFEPRPVETGRYFGDRVEIVRGVKAGEKIVVSGNFLLDSETRFKNAAAGIYGTPGRDPVCGMALDEERARSAGLTRQYGGKSWYFCSPEDMAKFDKTPGRFTGPNAAVEPMPSGHGAAGAPARHPSLPAGGGHAAGSSVPRGSGGVQPLPAVTPPARMPGMKAAPPGKVLLDRRGYPSIGVDIDDAPYRGGAEEESSVPQTATDPEFPEPGAQQLDLIQYMKKTIPPAAAPGPATAAPAAKAPAKPAPAPDSGKAAPK